MYRLYRTPRNASTQPETNQYQSNRRVISAQISPEKKKQNEKYRYKRRLYPSSPPVADDRLPSNLN